MQKPPPSNLNFFRIRGGLFAFAFRETQGQRFEPAIGKQYVHVPGKHPALIAQLGERQTEDLKVLCSIHS